MQEAFGASRGVVLSRAGQMTVEFIVALPVLVAVAVVAFNALVFIGDCAVVDRQFKLAVCTHAASPAYGEGQGAICGRIQAQVASALDTGTASVSVESTGGAPGYATYTVHLSYRPTLFGRPLASSVFGVALPEAQHSASLSIDPYKPGAIV